MDTLVLVLVCLCTVTTTYCQTDVPQTFRLFYSFRGLTGVVVRLNPTDSTSWSATVLKTLTFADLSRRAISMAFDTDQRALYFTNTNRHVSKLTNDGRIKHLVQFDRGGALDGVALDSANKMLYTFQTRTTRSSVYSGLRFLYNRDIYGLNNGALNFRSSSTGSSTTPPVVSIDSKNRLYYIRTSSSSLDAVHIDSDTKLVWNVLGALRIQDIEVHPESGVLFATATTGSRIYILHPTQNGYRGITLNDESGDSFSPDRLAYDEPTNLLFITDRSRAVVYIQYVNCTSYSSCSFRHHASFPLSRAGDFSSIAVMSCRDGEDDCKNLKTYPSSRGFVGGLCAIFLYAAASLVGVGLRRCFK
mmetsp:Transcript_10990/g.12069  ORF Transcript_10990/g.12069 Transcript_10990/m.12069 type:complete len:360 (+) Transcript_10990:33-1112(+)